MDEKEMREKIIKGVVSALIIAGVGGAAVKFSVSAGSRSGVLATKARLKKLADERHRKGQKGRVKTLPRYIYDKHYIYLDLEEWRDAGYPSKVLAYTSAEGQYGWEFPVTPATYVMMPGTGSHVPGGSGGGKSKSRGKSRKKGASRKK